MADLVKRALLTALASLALAAVAAPAAQAQQLWDEEVECLEPLPRAAGVPGVTDAGQRVSLAVAVLLDGVAQADGERIMARAADAYRPIGIDLVVSSWTGVAFSGTDARGLNHQARAHFGGARPAHADLVYTLTAKDIDSGGNKGVAGMADCIGGVRFPHRAFAVGEKYRYDNLTAGPFTFYKDGSSKIGAHELGHLMGAHHHYANCAEGTEGANTVTEASPCSLMTNFVDFMALKFAIAEAAVIRGHAVSWARAAEPIE